MSPDFYTPLDYAIACLEEAREAYKENFDFDLVNSELEIAKQSIDIAKSRNNKAKIMHEGFKKI